MRQLNRRDFIKFLGLSAGSIGLAGCGFSANFPFQNSGSLGEELFDPSKLAKFSFKSLAATDINDLVLAEGFEYNIIRSWGDFINSKEQFGYNNDFTAFIGLDDFTALLWSNHESIDPKYIKGEKLQRKSVGGSIMAIEKDGNDNWQFANDAELVKKYNRRVDANTEIFFTGAVAEKYLKVNGTLANCSGGQTPWGTVLSCEENFHHFDAKFGWENFEREHYGWVVEINPLDPGAQIKKHSALGRFAHENATLTVSPGGKVVIYMGDDKAGEHVYKFVSAKTLNSEQTKLARQHFSYKSTGSKNILREQMKLLGLSAEFGSEFLAEGDLYVAKNDIARDGKMMGKWLWLNIENPLLTKHFSSQAELLINTRKAAKLVGASALDRPEDLEVSPYDGSVFIALSQNFSAGNFHGSIARIHEDDPESLDFDFSTYFVGGEDQEMSCPDNLAFDNKGNLWVTTDIKSAFLNRAPYMHHGNNSLFVIPLFGEEAGIAKRFASGPVGCELTGPSFSDDFSSIFVSVQHPGESNKGFFWPQDQKHNPEQIPKPSVVSIKIA